ncbi:MAG: ABC transporter ATP-binding protein [Gemmatimonadaceae bacterium]
MRAPALEIDDLSVRFGAKTILQKITLEVGRGERFAIVGPSGAGKTTLLRAVAGFVPADSGEIKIGGRVATSLPPERRDAVYMHQAPVLFPHLSVFENVAFPLRVRHEAAGEIRKRVDGALNAMQMAKFGNRIPATLSGGQKHRAALARAIVARPTMLLLDEPFTALDPALKHDVRLALLAAHSHFEPGLIVVTHDFGDASAIADRIGVLIDGKLVQVAPPAALFSRPASLDIARFLNIANEVRGDSDGCGTFCSTLGNLRTRDTIVAGPAIAVFNAAAVRIGLEGGAAARVIEVRTYPEHTTLMLGITGGRLEAACPAGSSLAAGDETTVELDVARVAVFPLPAGQLEE